jgi:transcriptional regulator with XRE-family HTH domain
MSKKLSRTSPIVVKRALRKLGEDLRLARRLRRIPIALMAERVGVARTTLARAEKGDSTVSVGVYASMLFVLGLIDRLSEVASVKFDDVGIALEEEQLPKRIRLKRPKTES